MSRGRGQMSGKFPGQQMFPQQNPPGGGFPFPQQDPNYHNDLNFGMKNLGLGSGPVDPALAQYTAALAREQELHKQNMMMQNVYHPTDSNRSNPAKAPMSGMDFLSSVGFGGPGARQSPRGMRHPGTGQTSQASNMGHSPHPPNMGHSPHTPNMGHPPQMGQSSPHGMSNVGHSPQGGNMGRSPGGMVAAPFLQQSMAAAAVPRSVPAPPNGIHGSGAAAATSSAETNLSVSASEFVPTFRKPEKAIILYSPESFKKKSRADDEMAINDVKKKLLQLFNNPQDVETVFEPSVDTIKSWTTSVNTYHQIVEDIFEFSVDEVNHPNFYPFGSKILNFLTLRIPPHGSPPFTFFDTIVHKCCREFDNCMRLDQHLPASQDRIKNVALMISDLFHTIKEGELRVFLFAEQVTSLCLVLVQIKTLLAIETVAKIFLVCGADLRNLVDDTRFKCIMQHLNAAAKLQLDRKTRAMVENVMTLDEGGWIKEDSTPQRKSWSGGDDCAPVSNTSEWDDYATDDYDEEWLTEMLRFEEEDDFSDVEEDFKKFMEEAALKYKN